MQSPAVEGIPAQVLRYLGLQKNPFSVTPDPAFLFLSKTHREALASLLSGIQFGAGFQVLVARPGLGKTTLLFQLLEQFCSSARTAFLFQQQQDPPEFLHSLLFELRAPSGETGFRGVHEELTESSRVNDCDKTSRIATRHEQLGNCSSNGPKR